MVATIDIGYLEGGYLLGDYLSAAAGGGLGSEITVSAGKGLGVEIYVFSEAQKGLGIQLKVSRSLGYIHCDPDEFGYLVQDYLTTPYLVDNMCVGLGTEINVLSARGLGVELTVRQYNTTRTRILCDFPSRGDGSNWTASSTKTSATDSFNINNVNTDEIEDVWRSASGIKTSIQLNCDAGVGNIIFADTVFFDNHNFTTSANISMLGSNDPTFTIVGVTIPITITSDAVKTKKFFYIAPDFPLEGYRYWRFDIDDGTNAADSLQIGVIAFGDSQIMEDVCYVPPIEFERVEYADVVATEGFTNVMNVRGRRNKLKLNFKNIVYGSLDEQRFDDIFSAAGTTLKCVWIPLPEAPYRYGIFAKLVQIPRYRDNAISVAGDYRAFTVDLDEAR